MLSLRFKLDKVISLFEFILRCLQLISSEDSEEIIKIVTEVISDNQDVVERIKDGEEKLIGFLVGQIIKSSGGNINPSIAKELLLKEL